MKTTARWGLLALGAFSLMAFTAKVDKNNPNAAEGMEPNGQPTSERKAQESLPMAGGTVWATLMQSKITYSNKAPHITAKLTPEIKAMAGRTVSVSGFIMPMDARESSSHFLLSKRTPTCFFCPPGEPNEVIEVFTAKPVKVTDGMVTIRGKFALTNNTDNGVFFVLKEAVSESAQKDFVMPNNIDRPLY